MFRNRRRQGSAAAQHAFDGTARELKDRHSELSDEIANLENFICEAPARAAEIRLDRMETIPPPEVFDGLPAENVEPPRLSRSQAAVARAYRRRNMVVFLFAATGFAAFANWLAQAI